MLNKLELNDSLELEYESLLSHQPGSSPSIRRPPSLPAPLSSTEHWQRVLIEWKPIKLASSIPHSKAKVALSAVAGKASWPSKPAPDISANLPDSCMNLSIDSRNPICHKGLDRFPSLRASKSPGPGSLLLPPGEQPPCLLCSWSDLGEGSSEGAKGVTQRLPHIVRVKHCDVHLSGAWLTPALQLCLQEAP